MDNTSDLALLLASRYPVILVEERDEQRFTELARRAAATAGLPFWTWSALQGLERDGSDPEYGTKEAARAIGFISQLREPGVFVFFDVHPALSDPLLVRQIKEFAQADRLGQALILTAPNDISASELEGLAVHWKLLPPAEKEIEEVIRRTVAHLTTRNIRISLDAAQTRSLVEAVRGLSAIEAERIIQEAALKDGALDGSDVPFLRQARAHLLATDRTLELVETGGTLESVGDMRYLKEWLRLRGRALEPAAADFGLEPPRGILLTGVPGCGKSLVAKTIAGTWGLPLVLLDPARLFGPYVGESEQRLRDTISTIEAMAPVVVWVDEIEKGFASGSDNDGGVGRRVLGTFLRWMQERPPGIFVVATANDVVSLPPEFLRKGRFDQIFFVDLPGPADREEILRLHLAKRGRRPEAFDLSLLAGAMQGFTGAEIEGAVVGALYRAYASGTDLTTQDVLAEAKAIVPLSRTREEDVVRLRAWATGRAAPV